MQRILLRGVDPVLRVAADLGTSLTNEEKRELVELCPRNRVLEIEILNAEAHTSPRRTCS